MKKFSALLLVVFATVFGMHAGELWVLGQVGDQTWAPNVGTPMELTQDADGIDCFYLKAHFNSSSYFSFTSMLSESADGWDEIKPYRFGAMSNNYSVDPFIDETNWTDFIACGPLGQSSDNAFLIEQGADYEVFVYMLEDESMVKFHKIPGTDEELLPPVVDGNIYVLGTINGGSWDPTNHSVKMEKVSENVFTLNVVVADSSANFSFTKAYSQNNSNDWATISSYRFGAVEGSSEVVLDTPLPVSEDGVSEPSFSILQGNYVFTLDLEARTLTVAAAGEFDPEMYIIGGNPFNGWNPENGVKMEYKGNGYFTYEADIDIETTYFIFADACGIWDVVNNGHRYGPTDENQEVVPGQMMTTQLSTNGNASYFVAGGKYLIHFQLLEDGAEFKFEPLGVGTTGDVDGDGKVDVGDVNKLVNIILGKEEATPNANVDGEGTVDVQDINTLINILLGKN